MDNLALTGSSLIIFSVCSYLLLSWWIRYKSVQNWITYANHLTIGWILTSFFFLLPDLLKYSAQTSFGTIPIWVAGFLLFAFSIGAYRNNGKMYGLLPLRAYLLGNLSAISFVALRLFHLASGQDLFITSAVLTALVMLITFITYSKHFREISFTPLYYVLSGTALQVTLAFFFKKWDTGFSIFVLVGALMMQIIGIAIFYLEFFYKARKTAKEIEIQLERRSVAEQNRSYYLENYDSMTRLRNQVNLARKYEVWREDQSLQWLALINIVNFKQYNNLYGYKSGNELLKKVADWLLDIMREERNVFRFENDVFLIRFKGSEEAVEVLAGDLHESFMATFGKEFEILDLNIQIFLTPIKSIFSLDEHIQELNIARELACETQIYSFYDGSKESLYKEKMELQALLKEAIRQEQFTVLYQPKVNLETHEVVGAEALVRLITPNGIISPAQFIPLAEETGLIKEIGYQVLKQVFIQSKKSNCEMPISINLSAIQLFSETFISELEYLIAAIKVPTDQFILEITESAVMKNFDEGVKQLHRLRALGFKVSLDDFGTGYSSFAYLMHMPIQEIKVDRSLVRDISKEKKQQILMKTLLNLGQDLEVSVVIEGIETEDQKLAILSLGGMMGQGYYFSKPIPWHEFELFTKSESK